MKNPQLLTLAQVATLLGRRPETIRKDPTGNPLAVPPRVVIPGTRLLLWRAVDVEGWLARHIVDNASVREA